MIPLRTIEFELNEPESVVRNISYHIRKKSRFGTFLNWGWNVNSKMVGYIDPDKSEFILNPVIERWSGNRPSLVKINGKVNGQRSIKATLNLSFSGTTTIFGCILFLLFIVILPNEQPSKLILQIVLVAAVISNFYLIYRDLNRTEIQLDKLIELVEIK